MPKARSRPGRELDSEYLRHRRFRRHVRRAKQLEHHPPPPVYAGRWALNAEWGVVSGTSGATVMKTPQLALEKRWLNWLRCPDCRQGTPRSPAPGAALRCDYCGADFPVVAGHPVLMRHDNAVFPIQSYIGERPEKRGGRLEHLAQALTPDISVNLAGDATLRNFARQLDARAEPSVLVLGCGSQRDVLPALFPDPERVQFVYSDVDIASLVDLYCDGHDLPFQDETFDGVISCAVLEHVMYPERVVAEVQRVLKQGGNVYSEIPFMQQVHEGAYDFTRYSLSGHRRLFNHFRELQSGMVAGPGTALAWAIENFVLSFASSRPVRLVAKAVVRWLFFWLKYVDHWLARRPQAMDGASCTFFLGAKQSAPVPDAEIIARYVGLKHLRHL